MKIRLAFGLFIIILVLRWFACDPGSDKGPVRHLTNRVWVDRATKDPRQMVFRLALFGKAQRRMGFVVNASVYRFMGEMVQHRVKGDELTLTFLQTKTKASFKARTWACNDAPKPFDLCLELKQGDRKVVLYSQRKRSFQAADFEAFGLDFESAPAPCEDCAAGQPTWFPQAVRVDSED